MMIARSRILRSNRWCTSDELLLELVSNEYQERCYCNGLVTVPHFLHFIWLGGELPLKFKPMVKSWEEKHPSWQLCIWGDSDLDELDTLAETNVKHGTNFGMKSDILRYEILNSIGGVYVDVDYECMSCIDSLVDSCSFFCGFSNTAAVEINNGIMGSIAGHPILKMLISSINATTLAAAAVPPTTISADDTAGTHSSSSIAATTSTGTNNTRIGLLSSLSSFLCQEDSKALRTAVAVPTTEATSIAMAMDTISKTGPGLLTRIVYEYLVSKSHSNALSRSSSSSNNSDGSFCDPSLTTDDDQPRTLAPVYVCPYWCFHAVPNDVSVDIADDMLRSEVRERYVPTETATELERGERPLFIEYKDNQDKYSDYNEVPEYSHNGHRANKKVVTENSSTIVAESSDRPPRLTVFRIDPPGKPYAIHWWQRSWQH